MLKKIVLLFSVVIIFCFCEGVVLAIPTINCPASTCRVGNCPCTISNCNSGYIDIYTSQCTFSPIDTKIFTNNNIIIAVSGANSYYVKVYCDDPSGQSACTNIVVSSPTTTTTSITTTTFVGTTTTQPTVTTMTTTTRTTTTSTSTTTTMSGGTTTTTIASQDCSDSSNPCQIKCGDKINNRGNNVGSSDYYTFSTTATNDITVKLQPDSTADYDLYANSDWSDGSIDRVCSNNREGVMDLCSQSGLEAGTYYFKIYHLRYNGNYNLTLTCTPSSGVTTTTIEGTTTTIGPQDCYSFATACDIKCGKTLRSRQTDNKNYLKFTLNSTSDVTIRMPMTSNADYDFYIKWDGNEPTVNDYDCKSSKDTGITEECFKSNLVAGTYYMLIVKSQGYGTYDISLSCPSIEETTTTIKAQNCSSFDKACKLSCDHTFTGSTSEKDYYQLNIQPKSDVKVTIIPSSTADYDLYTKWGNEEPTENSYDCISSKEAGMEEECSQNNLEAGTYYAMVHLYGNSGTYKISLYCIGKETTTPIGETTTSIFGITTTSIESETTTIEETTTTTMGCSNNGYCEQSDVDCNSGYSPCTDNTECYTDMKCCCLSQTSPKKGSSYGIILGLFLTFVLAVLIFLYIKNKSTLTYEKLYQKWARIY